MNLKRLHILLLVLLIIFSCPFLNAQSGWATSGGAKFCGVSGNGFISLQPGYTDTISYWETSTDSITWTNTGNTINTEGYSGLTQTTYYRVVFKNSAHPPSDTSISSVSAVTVYQPTVAGSISGGGTFCIGAGVLTLTGYTGNILRWQYSIDTAKTWTSVANTTSHYSYNITKNTMYEAVVRNSSYCKVDSSSRANVAISTSKGGKITGGGTFCDSSGSGTLRLSGYSGNIVTWQYSADSSKHWHSTTITTDSLKYKSTDSTIIYRVIVDLPGCPADSTSLTAFVIQKSIAGKIVNNDTTINYNDNNNADQLQLTGSSGTIDWKVSTNNGSVWNNINNPTTSQPYSNSTKTSLYRAIVKYATCKSDTSNTVKITVLGKSIGKVPNLFTPNGDGINDTWFVDGLNNYDDNEVSVYNIYGNMVYSKKPYNNDWSGTYNGAKLPDGTYYYVITFDDSNTVIKGAVDILR